MTVHAGIDPHTAASQTVASDPAISAWVAANAGSGKTFVLARRVIRLLLAGIDPGRILCLTFTKAAAAEMAKRVFGELAKWTRLDDPALAATLADLDDGVPDTALLARARRLFTSALDTPGGLKIQTIHAFCERLLHQFPFEANIAGHFEVLDEHGQAALSVEARKAVLARAADDPDGALGSALKTVLDLVSDYTHEASIAEFVERRDRLGAWLARTGSLEAALDQLRHSLTLRPDETVATTRARIVAEAELDRAAAADLVTVLETSGSSDRDAGERLAAFVRSGHADLAAVAYLDFYRTDAGEFRDRPVTKKTLQARPGLADLLEREKARLMGLLDRLRTAELYESTQAMLLLSTATISEYERRKRQRSLLDFEDLVVGSVRLLGKADASRWVQYKLDRGIDHILVDEAQDTSPRQWQVIRALIEEFFAGEGASAETRSIFAVGDEKQSIFSFQGAAPQWFSKVRREVRQRALLAGYTFEERELHLSFRSVPVILDAVDLVFQPAAVHAGLTAESGPPTHAARRRNQAGRVVVWPAILAPEEIDPTDWATPLDHLDEKSPEQQLAFRIARTVKGWLARGETLDAPGDDGKPRPIQAGGILVLLRTRGALSDAINRQLRTEGVPIAGSDRMTLTEHIAVMDLCALARIVLTPEDDLSLAALLRSPLIGLDEQALFDMAHGRKGSLWAALEASAAAAPEIGRAKALIDAWRTMAETCDPHAFFAQVLARDNGRRAFLTRLGPEALDVLDEFMGEALAYEESNTPSLEGFLDWLQSSDTEIKRDSDSLRDEVRVMTVHGAKGLEADVVFLVDNGMQPTLALHDPRLLPLEERDDPDDPGPMVWNRSIKAMPQMVRDRIKAWRAKSEEEYRRLLYVGMTRARDRLYVVGLDKRPPKDAASDNRWHAIVRRALDADCIDCSDAFGFAAMEWRPATCADIAVDAAAPRAAIQLPPWATQPPPTRATHAGLRLTPSIAVAAPKPIVTVAPGGQRGGENGLERGRLMHRLLQSLPDVAVPDRPAVGSRYLAAAARGLGDGDRDQLLGEVLAILADLRFAEVFNAGSRAEIDIVGHINTRDGRAEVMGRIDRLAVTAERVVIVDYKTNRPAPARVDEVPPQYVAQLALYRAVLRPLYAGRIVEAGLLWTEIPALMTVPAAALDAAEVAILRGGGGGPP